MAEKILRNIFFANDNQELVKHFSHFLIFSGFLITIMSYFGYSPAKCYGRYESWKGMWKISASLSWFLQESPAFFLPLYVILYHSNCHTTFVNQTILSMFMLHYFQRSFIYPLIRNGKPMPIDATLAAIIFCSFNGYMQGLGVGCQTQYPANYFTSIRFILGVAIFVVGLVINIHSDYSLANLRKPGETAYKIPKGGIFEIVSCANYLGEICEWWGYALAANSYVATAFAVFSLLFLSSRASSHHKFYLDRFKNYPANRKAVIPFVF